jgi:hypothetical protein
MIIRNKYAHLSENSIDDECCRDVDTLYRFAKGIGATEELLFAIKSIAGNLSNSVGKSDVRPVIPEMPFQSEVEESVSFRAGEIVKLKSAPEITGAVVSVSDDEVTVFVNGEIIPFFTDQLERNAPKEEKFCSLAQVKNNLTSFLIRHPSIPSLYSLHAARIDIIP